MKETVNVVDIVSQIKSDIQKKTGEIQQSAVPPVGNRVQKTSYKGIAERVRDKEEIIIVGAGSYGKKLYEIFKANGIESVQCFADNSSANYVNGVYDKRVISIEEAVKEYKEAYYIVTPKYYLMEIIRQLVFQGVSINNIDIYGGF